jgi:cytochrome c553
VGGRRSRGLLAYKILEYALGYHRRIRFACNWVVTIPGWPGFARTMSDGLAGTFRKPRRFVMRPTRSIFAVLSWMIVGTATAAPPARENFEKHCADCHGADGKSQTRLGRRTGAKDLSDKAGQAKLTDEDVFKTIKFGRKDDKGREKMDAFGAELSDAEILELVAFVRTLAK